MLNEQHIWNWLKQCSGLNDYAIAAIMGNIEHESAGIPNNVEDRCPIPDATYTQMVDRGTYSSVQWETDGYGYGLCQWTYPPRKRALLQFAKSKGTSISDMDMQLEFLIKELMSDYKTVWNSLMTAANVAAPCDRFLREFENPANVNAQVPGRNSSAMAIYDRNHGKDATCLPSSASTASSTNVFGNTASSVSGSSSKCTVSMPVLKRGCNGIAVRVLQAALIQRGCKLPQYGIDGDFGSETENAVKLFQASGKVTADGVVGSATYELLFK